MLAQPGLDVLSSKRVKRLYICATTSFFLPIKAHRSVIAFNHRIPYICRRFSDILSHRIFRQLPLKSCSTTQCLIIESLFINKWLFTNAFSVYIREMEIVLVTCQNSVPLRGWNIWSLNHSWPISIYFFIVYVFNFSNWWQRIFSKTFRLCIIRFTSDVCYVLNIESTCDYACAFPPIYIVSGAWAFLILLFSNYCVEVNHRPKLKHLTELSEYSMCVIYFKLYIPYMRSLSIILYEFRKGCCVIHSPCTHGKPYLNLNCLY